MDVLQHDYFFWKLIDYFVHERNYRVLNQQGMEVWLEEDGVKPNRVFRIVRKDIDWGNRLKQDILEAGSRFEYIRKQLGLKELEAENLYVSLLPPVDEWEYLQKTVYVGKGKRTKMRSTLLLQDEEQRNRILEERFPKLRSMEIRTFSNSVETEAEIVRIEANLRQSTKEKQAKERSLFTFGKPLLTYLLMAVSVLLFMYVETNGESTSVSTLIEYGAKYNPLILEGEWWRLLTAMFLHIGVVHLAMNMLALFYLGGMVERIYGTGRFFRDILICRAVWFSC